MTKFDPPNHYNIKTIIKSWSLPKRWRNISSSENDISYLKDDGTMIDIWTRPSYKGWHLRILRENPYYIDDDEDEPEYDVDEHYYPVSKKWALKRANEYMRKNP